MEQLSAFLQTLLPQHLISRLTGWLAATEIRPVKKILISLFVRLYKIDLAEAESAEPDSYASFNAFFTRALKENARPVSSKPGAVVSPVDGRISQFGDIEADQILQAKGRQFTVSDLLADHSGLAAQYENGRFMTIYLAPHNYHRIHMPSNGQLRQMTFVPGRLFSVSPATARGLDRLYARNERVVFHFDSDSGPFALVMVGAMNVGSIETVHAGVIAPGGRQLRHWHYDPPLAFDGSQELARFNLGSTVILLYPEQGPVLAPGLQTGQAVVLGQAIAQL